MKISIAMATYNGAKYLQKQLESLASQSLPPFELVICDDGSADDTLSIAHEFAKSAPFPVRIYQNEGNLGYGENFLRAAALCAGDWIAFCDQDDVWNEQKLETCVRHIEPGVTMIYHSADVVDAHLKPLTGYKFQTGKQKKIKANGFPPWKSIAGFTILFDATIPFKDTRNRPHDPYRPEVRFAHDQWIPFIATIFGTIVFIPDRLALYRQHGGNTMSALPFKADAAKRFGQIQSQASDYLALSRLSSERAHYLGTLIEKSTEPLGAVKQAYYRYASHTRYIFLRHALYAKDSFFKRVAILFELIWGCGYGSTDSGGLGPRAFVRDAINLFHAR